MLVPVVDKNQNPLMPSTSSRARRWIKSGRATPFWKKGVFCVRLNEAVSGAETQQIIVGIDTGSKREAYTVATKKQVILNILTNTPDWVSKAVKTRRELRQGRRFRKTPCRKPNSMKGGRINFLSPSVRARWQTKLRIIGWLTRILPITDVVIEDIKVGNRKGESKWNGNFSMLEVGKGWLYDQLGERFNFHKIRGYQTKAQRDKRGFKKSKNKLEESWEAHNVDSHCLVEMVLKTDIDPMKQILRLHFLQLHRRRLHYLQPEKGGKRKRYGGTMSLGFKRGSLIKSPKYGLAYVGGYLDKRLSLHDFRTGKRVTQIAKPEECSVKTYSTWRWSFILQPTHL